MQGSPGAAWRGPCAPPSCPCSSACRTVRCCSTRAHCFRATRKICWRPSSQCAEPTDALPEPDERNQSPVHPMAQTSTLSARAQAPAPAADPDQRLRERIASRTARVGVVGLGAVGLPLAEAFVEAGFRVHGHETDRARVEEIARGLNPLGHLRPGMVEQLRASGRFEASADEALLGELDVALVCVPTPLDARREPDLGAVREAARVLASNLRPGPLAALGPTTWPGTKR